MLRRYLTVGFISLGLLATSLSASAADYVAGVQVCPNGNAFVIQLDSGKNIYAYLPDLTQNEFDHLYAMALELLASQKQIGFYNNVGTGNTCGYSNMQEITTMTATNKA